MNGPKTDFAADLEIELSFVFLPSAIGIAPTCGMVLRDTNDYPQDVESAWL